MTIQHPHLQIPLKGVAIGNGWVNPAVQYKASPWMAFTGGAAEGGSLQTGVVDGAAFTRMKHGLGACESSLRACEGEKNVSKRSAPCILALYTCTLEETLPVVEAGKNLYDLRQPCSLHPQPGIMACINVTKELGYWSDQTVRQAFGVIPDSPWNICSEQVNMDFMVDGGCFDSYSDAVAQLLEAGIPVLAYAGDTDFQCNFVGVKAWMLQLAWSHKEEWNAATEKDFNVGGRSVGRERSVWGLTFLQIYRAGHMVPSEQPESLLPCSASSFQ